MIRLLISVQDWNTNSLTSWGMKEVTPDNDNLKSSVFHRLLQRAFPEWFSYDSVRFFHPFYTSQQNALYAQAQGYDKTFKMESKIVTNEHNKSITTWDNPSKPLKPVYLSNIDDISAILTDKGESLVHPARLRLKDMPRQIREILEIKRDNSDVREQAVGANCSVKDEALREYFEKLSHDIIMREFIVMDKRNPEDPIYQIDVTRE